jgi:hypothetical protein
MQTFTSMCLINSTKMLIDSLGIYLGLCNVFKIELKLELVETFELPFNCFKLFELR